jgi:two-component system sensor histidine kinase/response regulator
MPNPVEESTPAILVVDDNRANLLAFEAVLDPLGYRIVGANSGAEAVARLRHQDFVVILMDVHMPGLDGYQTVQLIRERRWSRDIPVIFVTAVYNQQEHTYRGYALGAVDYMTKPFDPEVLRAKVRALVNLYTRGSRAERERAQYAERMKDLFLGAVGHDLRNPLNTIIAAAQLMLHGDDLGSAAQRTYAEKIERAGRRMQRMLEDILDLTRGQFAGGIPLSPRSMDLGEVCRTVVDDHRIAHPNHLVELEITGDVRGRWDPGRIDRVVSNLVGNAAEHGGDGPVRVRVRDADVSVMMEVWNGGTPIEPEILPEIFDPFRRGKTAGAGLGLGLYIVREIVRAHAGTVKVGSNAHDGTTFTVTLPRPVGSNSDDAPRTPGEPSLSNDSDLGLVERGKRVGL